MKRFFAALLAALFSILSTAAMAQEDSTHALVAEEGEEGAAPVVKTARFGITAEVGVNSLASVLGTVFTYYPNADAAVDFGLGLSFGGFRPGVRGRYLFHAGRRVLPFVGGALKFQLGSTMRSGNSDSGGFVNEVRVDPGAYFDLVGGLEFHFGRFRWDIGSGWSQSLTGSNWALVSGPPLSSDEILFYDLMLGSGFTLYTGLGAWF